MLKIIFQNNSFLKEEILIFHKLPDYFLIVVTVVSGTGAYTHLFYLMEVKSKVLVTEELVIASETVNGRIKSSKESS